MRGFAISKKWAILALLCGVVVALSLIFCGSLGATKDATNNWTTDNMSETNSTTNVEGSSSSSSLMVTGGTYATSDGVSTATAESGYELGYWNRTLNSVTAKFATTPSVTVGSGESYEPVFVTASSFTEVSTASDLQTALSGNQNIRLTCDIDATSSFTPAGTFSGLLDGAGYKITLNYSATTASLGGLCQTLTGVIKNVVLDGVIKGTGDATQVVGGFAGSINGGLISQCENKASVCANLGVAGSFVAQATNTTVRGSTINGCSNFGSVLGAKVGAIIFTNGTTASPLVNLVNNKNSGAMQTISIA